jgi:hypothetical protein
VILDIEISKIKKRISSGEVFNLDTFINTNPQLYEAPLALWPDMEDKDANTRFAANSTSFFGERWRSRFVYYPKLLRAIQYGNKRAVVQMFFENKFPGKDEIVTAIWTTLVQIAGAEIHPNSLEVAAYFTKSVLFSILSIHSRAMAAWEKNIPVSVVLGIALHRHFMSTQPILRLTRTA